MTWAATTGETGIGHEHKQFPSALSLPTAEIRLAVGGRRPRLPAE